MFIMKSKTKAFLLLANEYKEEFNNCYNYNLKIINTFYSFLRLCYLIYIVSKELTLFYSTNRTKNYRNIGLFIIPIGLLVSFFLIAPESYGGFNLGAYGLVCQMLIVQLLSTNIMLFSNSKYLKILKKNKVEIHVRSIFLQGMLLSDIKNIPKKFKSLKNKLIELSSSLLERQWSLLLWCPLALHSENFRRYAL